MKGAYCLLIRISKPISARIGSLGKLDFGPGLYVYIGSAMNGLEQRIGRHLRKEKKLFWHIDYLLGAPGIRIEKIYYRESREKEECAIAKNVAREGEPVRGFGCSDCKCESHLYKVDSCPNLKGFKEFKSQ